MTDEKGNKTAEPNDKTWHVSTCLQVTERGIKSNGISQMNVLTVRLLLLLQLPLLSLWDAADVLSIIHLTQSCGVTALLLQVGGSFQQSCFIVLIFLVYTS